MQIEWNLKTLNKKKLSKVNNKKKYVFETVSMIKYE